MANKKLRRIYPWSLTRHNLIGIYAATMFVCFLDDLTGLPSRIASLFV